MSSKTVSKSLDRVVVIVVFQVIPENKGHSRVAMHDYITANIAKHALIRVDCKTGTAKA
jgi:hypothetical protein